MTVDELVEALQHPRRLDADTHADLAAALKRIPRLYSRLLLLHYQEGYSLRDAEHAAGSRSRSVWERARNALLKEMNHE